MKVRVRLFGSLREAAGQRELEVEIAEGTRVADLRGQLAARFAPIAGFGDRLAISVNLEVARPERALVDGDEVALLPPVAGGAGVSLCRLRCEPLVEADVMARVTGADMGGVVSFVGTVRNRARGRDIRYLEYEAYAGMAEREMQKIADEAAERWPGTRVAIDHRVGRLEIGDAAVVIVAAAPHRGAAFEACRFAIDSLKQSVPIWKKEVALDGEYWVDDHA